MKVQRTKIGSATSEVTTPQLACELCGDGDGNVELQWCKLALLQHCKLVSRQCCGAVAARVAGALRRCCSTRRGNAAVARIVAALLQQALRHCCNRRCGAALVRVAAALRRCCCGAVAARSNNRK